MGGCELIRIERVRQVLEEGYTLMHDDTHTHGELALAGVAYALSGLGNPAMAQSLWPWDDGWKPNESNRIHNLTRAGALIAAEIDRLLRAEGAAPAQKAWEDLE